MGAKEVWIDSAVRLFRSPNRAVRIRAAKVLMIQWRDLPLSTILEILDDLSYEGLGAGVERILLKRDDVELVNEMVDRLRSPAPFVREVACKILGRKGGCLVTDVLLLSLRDPSLMVRRAAALALAEVKDPASVSRLLQRYEASAKDDINVRWAMERALDQMGAAYTKPDTRTEPPKRLWWKLWT